MLNISKHSISAKVKSKNYSALSRVEGKVTKRILIRILQWGLLFLIILAFLPWTQNVRSIGSVTTLNPDQRPQTIHSVIAGRIDKWSVREGDVVRKGDTIAIISEIKDDYFDDLLVPRTKNQLELKKQSASTYAEKEGAQTSQLNALKRQIEINLDQAEVKLQQAKLKVQIDSIVYRAALLNSKTADRQFRRLDSLYKQGLKSLVDLESRRIKRQQTQAYEIEARNKWQNSQSEVRRLQLELSALRTKFENDYAKVLSERLTTSTTRFDAESTINKLENQIANYEVRKGYYAITAPQDGMVTKTFVNGIGETIKEGQVIVSIMPRLYDLAVEIFVEPIDLPLLDIGENVRIQFDGWPAIVFSGWPSASYGTYGGKIYAIDQFASKNGKFRILVKPDISDHVWPDALRFGGGVKSMILLDDVRIWYELWRKINGFPPNFYTSNSSNSPESKKK